MRSLHVAAAQIHSKAGHIEENLHRMHRQIESAAAVEAQAILFAETCVHAYDFSPDNLAKAESLDGPICNTLSAWAQQYELIVMAGFIERHGDALHNSHLVAWPNGERGVQRKHSLTDPEKNANLTPGPARRVPFDLCGIRAAVVICADGGIETLKDDLAEQRIEYRFCPTAGGGNLKDMLRETDLDKPDIRTRYAESRTRVFKTEALLDKEKNWPGCGFTSANALGYDGRDACHQGHCMIVDNRGIMRAQIPGTTILEHQEDQMIHATLRFP